MTATLTACRKGSFVVSVLRSNGCLTTASVPNLVFKRTTSNVLDNPWSIGPGIRHRRATLFDDAAITGAVVGFAVVASRIREDGQTGCYSSQSLNTSRAM